MTKPADDDLTLPDPARDFWLETRGLVRSALQQLEPGIDYRIGGGTILAAGWKHRGSFDVDIQVGKDTRLDELEGDAYGWLHAEIEGLGAKADYNADLNLYRIWRGDDPAKRQEVQVWGHELRITRGHTTARVEGREETVLSAAQILRGKLERAQRHPARDVYDVDKAADVDPVSLEIAVNTLRHDLVAKAALIWTVAYGRIGNQAHQRLVGLAPGEERRHYEIGKTGAAALLKARYAYLRLGVEDERIVVEALTQANKLRRMTMTPDEAEEQFEAKGINGHLRNKGPGASALCEYAVELCRKRAGDVLVFEEAGDRETRWRIASSGRNLKLISPQRPAPITGTAGGWERGRTGWGHGHRTST